MRSSIKEAGLLPFEMARREAFGEISEAAGERFLRRLPDWALSVTGLGLAAVIFVVLEAAG